MDDNPLRVADYEDYKAIVDAMAEEEAREQRSENILDDDEVHEEALNHWQDLEDSGNDYNENYIPSCYEV